MIRRTPRSTHFPYTTLFRSKRILDGRPKLKFFQAGMDLRLSADLYESFRIFQGRILEQYLAMSTEFNFSIDRKSTRLNSSHPSISYAVFCLKKKKQKTKQDT